MVVKETVVMVEAHYTIFLKSWGSQDLLTGDRKEGSLVLGVTHLHTCWIISNLYFRISRSKLFLAIKCLWMLKSVSL